MRKYIPTLVILFSTITMNDLELLTHSLEKLTELHAHILAERKYTSAARLESMMAQQRRKVETLRAKNHQLKQQLQLLRSNEELDCSDSYSCGNSTSPL